MVELGLGWASYMVMLGNDFV